MKAQDAGKAMMAGGCALMLLPIVLGLLGIMALVAYAAVASIFQ